jgi:putative endonuclease
VGIEACRLLGRPFSSVTHEPSPDHADHRLALGREGEDQAALWYVRHGYQIVERNWRSRIGEIDLVCARGNELIFCEVKTRSSDRLGNPLEAVTRAKQLRLRRLAAEYLFLHTCGCHRARFDVAAILGGTLTVIQGAF